VGIKTRPDFIVSSFMNEISRKLLVGYFLSNNFTGNEIFQAEEHISGEKTYFTRNEIFQINNIFQVEDQFFLLIGSSVAPYRSPLFQTVCLLFYNQSGFPVISRPLPLVTITRLTR